jgi:hypothetical protein
MISPVSGGRAPLSCQWILFRKWSDFLRASYTTRAVCLGVCEIPRIVTEKGCQSCKFWEPAARCES